MLKIKIVIKKNVFFLKIKFYKNDDQNFYPIQREVEYKIIIEMKEEKTRSLN